MLISSRRREASRAGRKPRSLAHTGSTLRHQHGALDGVVEFANIARPGMVEEHLHRHRFESLELLAITLRRLAQEMMREQRNIFLALAQRRQDEFQLCSGGRANLRESGRAVTSALHVRIRGGDDANVHAPCCGRADSLEFAGFEHAQQLGLQVHRHVGNFIQEKRAAVRQFESSDAIRLWHR